MTKISEVISSETSTLRLVCLPDVYWGVPSGSAPIRREGSRTQRKRGGVGLSNSICKLQKTELDLVTPFSPKMKLVKFLCIWGFLFVESVELIYYRCSSSLFHILVLNW